MEMEEKILKQMCLDRRFIVMLYNEKRRKNFRVHRLVAFAFVDGYMDGLEVNHKDCNPNNNRADNLEWVTSIENKRHAIENLGVLVKSGRESKLSKLVNAYDMNGNLVIDGFGMREAAKLGYCRGQIRLCCNGVVKSHRGLVWEFHTPKK